MIVDRKMNDTLMLLDKLQDLNTAVQVLEVFVSEFNKFPII